ncbi:MAG: hypothetical protein QXW35_02710 [Candidatus Aenigmatarchaeota archaeon]
MKKTILLILFLQAIFLISFSSLYFPGENAYFSVLLSDINGNVIKNANCFGYIFYPNGTLYKQVQLVFDENINLYRAEFKIPEVYGTYTQFAYCEFELFGRVQKRYAYNTFFVSNLREKIDEFISNLISNATININITADITGNITESLMNIAYETKKDIDDLIGLLLALHSTPETYKYCKDNKTLVIVKNAFWEINNKTYNITKNEEIQCQFGCNFEKNECNEPAYKTYIIIAGLIFVILIIILIIRAYL